MRVGDAIWSKAKRMDIKWRSWDKIWARSSVNRLAPEGEGTHLSLICSYSISLVIILVFVEVAWRVMWSVKCFTHLCHLRMWRTSLSQYIYVLRYTNNYKTYWGKTKWRKHMLWRVFWFLLLHSKIFPKLSSSKQQFISHDCMGWLCSAVRLFLGISCSCPQMVAGVGLTWRFHSAEHKMVHQHGCQYGCCLPVGSSAGLWTGEFTCGLSSV